MLIDHGADPNEVHPDAGGAALHAAASMTYTDDSSEFVRMLLRRGADTGIRTVAGKTALEIARSRRQAQEEELADNSGTERKPFDAVIDALEGQ